MKISGKGLGLAGSIVSIVFSFIGLIIGSLYTALLNEPEFVEELKRVFVTDYDMTSVEALESLEVVRIIFGVFNIGSLIYLILGIVALVLVILVKPKNVKTFGVIVLIIGILHIIGFRILSFVFLLVAGIQFLSYKQPQQVVVSTIEPEPVTTNY